MKCEICRKILEIDYNTNITFNKYINNYGWTMDWTQGDFCEECKDKARHNTDKTIQNVSQYIQLEKRRLKLKKLLSNQ